VFFEKSNDNVFATLGYACMKEGAAELRHGHGDDGFEQAQTSDT
jgi:hypothetical protein